MYLLHKKSDIMRRIVYFILIAVLLWGFGGCVLNTNTNEDVLVDKSVSVNEEASQKADDVDIDRYMVNDEDIADDEEKKIIQGADGTDVNNQGEKDEDLSTKNSNGENTDNEKVNNKAASQKDEDSRSAGKNEDKGGVKAEVQKHDLVELVKLDDSFVIDIKYATEDNFAKKKIYSMPLCLIHKNTAQKLIAANNEFKTLGYRIKVFDAYRPYSAQKLLWDAAEDKSYVADPKKGSKHNRGAAVDITLVDENGQELPMPSKYDEFSERSHIKYNQCDEQLIKNRELLGEIMVKHGFKRISTEWWHFDDTDALNYPLLDISFEEFLQENQN